MEQALRILILEDLPSDAELMVYELRQAGIPHSYRRVADRENFVAALEEDRPDIILSDFNLPGFDGHEALGPGPGHKPGYALYLRLRGHG